MGSRKTKRIREALGDANLQKALDRAASQHFQKYAQTIPTIPWEDIKKKARAIREENAKRLPELILKFKAEAENSGATVYRAETPEEALRQVEKILQDKKAKRIVKAKSMVSEEIGLNSFLESRGYQVVETDLGEWIIQLAKERPSHITAPALHKTKEEVARLLSRHLGRKIPADALEIARAAREEMRKHFIEADVGFSGANLAVAETGTLILVSNEGNARLATSLPPVHIAVVTTEKFVETLEQATALVKPLVTASSGMKLTAYVSLITGPSRTTDIEKELVVGVHGPQEVHIIILDNGRLKLIGDDDLEEVLYCLKCGGCMLVCPVFQALGGHVYGGPVYPGGIGVLLTAATQSLEEASAVADFCADCKKCEDFCPVGIHTGDRLIRLKEKRGAKAWEKALSRVFRERSMTEKGVRVLAVLQKLWQKEGYLKPLPLGWAKKKSLPPLRPMRRKATEKKGGEKIYLFEGCLGKFFFPQIRESASDILAGLGYAVVSPPDQVCCGAPSLHLGQKKDVRTLIVKNLKSFADADPDYILTVCPTGHTMLKTTYPQLSREASRWAGKIFDFTEFLEKKGQVPKIDGEVQPREVLYHHPCHSLNDPNLKEKPLMVLQESGYAPTNEDMPYACCGFCGVFSLKNPEVSARIWEKKEKKIMAARVSIIATDCPGCLFQLRASLPKGPHSPKAYHTAELVARALSRKSSTVRTGTKNGSAPETTTSAQE